MKTITCQEDLKCAIDELERQRTQEGEEIKESYHHTVESFKPSNMIKHAFSEVTHSPELKKDLAKGAAIMVVGFLAKKIITATSRNPIRRMLGGVAEVMVARYVAKHPEKFRALAIRAMKLILKLRGNKGQKALPAPMSIGS